MKKTRPAINIIIVLALVNLTACTQYSPSGAVQVKVVDETGKPLVGAVAVPAPPAFQKKSNSKGLLSFSWERAITAEGYEPYIIPQEAMSNKSILEGKIITLKKL